MSQFKNGHETVAKYHGTRALAAVYKGLQLVWIAAREVYAWFRTEGYFRSEPW